MSTPGGTCKDSALLQSSESNPVVAPRSNKVIRRGDVTKYKKQLQGPFALLAVEVDTYLASFLPFIEISSVAGLRNLLSYPLRYVRIHLTISEDTLSQAERYALLLQACLFLKEIHLEFDGVMATDVLHAAITSTSIKKVYISGSKLTLTHGLTIARMCSSRHGKRLAVDLAFAEETDEDTEASKLSTEEIEMLNLLSLNEACKCVRIHKLKFRLPSLIQHGLEKFKGLRHLRSLKLVDSGLTANNISLVMEALEASPCITKLDVSGNLLMDDGSRVVADVLVASDQLRELGMAKVGMSFVGAAALANALYENDTLGVLRMEDMLIGELGGRAIAHMLKSNTGLKELQCTRSLMGNTAGMEMCEALCENDTLEVLIISGNAIRGTFYDEFVEMTMQHGNLKYLSLTENTNDLGGLARIEEYSDFPYVL